MAPAPRPQDEAPLVLVVEDDESNRELFQWVLEHAGARVIVARDIEEARTLTSTVSPDLVLTDVRMPRGDGVRFVRALRANALLRDVPVLFVTGFLLPNEDLRDLQEQGPVEAVLKPFKPDVLVQYVQSLLARSASLTTKHRKDVTAERVSELRMNAQKLSEKSSQLIEKANALLRAKTVLLVEDDGAFRYAMGRMLRDAGAEVVETANLENALTVLSERPEIEAVVADVVLPDGLAPEGLKGIEQQRQLPVLYVTSYPDQLLRDYGLSARDPHLLVKPFDAATLVSRLAALGA